jgi:hypothetical protein
LLQLARDAVVAFAEEATPLLIDHGFDFMASAAAASGCPMCAVAINALKPSGDPAECNPMTLSEEVASCTGTSLSTTMSESQTEGLSEARSHVMTQMRQTFSEMRVGTKEDCSVDDMPAGRLYQLSTGAVNSKYPASAMGVTAKVCSFCFVPYDAPAPEDLPGQGVCGKLDCDSDILIAGETQVSTGEMKHGHKDAKDCDGGGTISFQCEYGKISVLNDMCQTSSSPTPAPTRSENAVEEDASPDVPDAPDAPDKKGPGENELTYVVECDGDCSETCYLVKNNDLEDKDMPLCTANDAVRGQSCVKCDTVSTVADQSLATGFGGALLFLAMTD